jgi:hypothetical protein
LGEVLERLGGGAVTKGGPGSGNFGHEGRPGEVGGSGPGGGTSVSSPEFKRWFGSSKVTNSDGTPKVMYHATTGDFSTFSPGGTKPDVRFWTHEGKPRSMIGESGRGFYFAPSPKDIPAAHHFSDEKPGANIMPVYLRVQNPLIFDDTTRDWAIDVIAEGHKEFPLLLTDESYHNLQHNGYDGVFIYRGPSESSVLEEIVVLDRKQIKSAIGNTGAYSEDPDITKSLKPLSSTSAVPSNLTKWDQEVMREIRPIWFGLFKKGGDRALKEIRRFPKHAKKMAVLSWAEMEASERVEVVCKGGPGSGNFGHVGRPGEVGGSGGGFTMPSTGTTVGDPSQPLYRFVSGDNLHSDYGMHWTHDRHEVEQMATEEAGFIITAKHPGVDAIMDWENPNDLPIMEREIGGYEYRDKVFPEVPVRPGTKLDILSIEKVGSDGTRSKVPIKKSLKATPSIIIPDWIEDPDVLDALEREVVVCKGGPGSGNFGHEGRPGEVGGSGPGGGEKVSSEMDRLSSKFSFKKPVVEFRDSDILSEFVGGDAFGYFDKGGNRIVLAASAGARKQEVSATMGGEVIDSSLEGSLRHEVGHAVYDSMGSINRAEWEGQYRMLDDPGKISGVAVQSEEEGFAEAFSYYTAHDYDNDLPENIVSFLQTIKRDKNQKSLKSTPSIVIPEWIEDPDVLDALEKEMFKFAHGINQTTADDLRAELMEGMENGETIPQLADRISGLSDEWVEGWRSEMIARTETARAFTTGHIEAWRSTGVVSRKAWVAAGDACFTADSLVLQYKGGRAVPTAIGTIKEGDLVIGGSGKPCRVTGTSCKEYSGDVVRGENFTATPDHMFRTVGGNWRPIGEYASETFLRSVVNFIVCKAKDIPAALRKVFVLPTILGSNFRFGMPVYAVALDDEFPVTDEEVHNPLPVHGDLLFKRDVACAEKVGHPQFNPGSLVEGLDVDDVAVDGTVVTLLPVRTSRSVIRYAGRVLHEFLSTGGTYKFYLRNRSNALHFLRVVFVSTFMGTKLWVASFFKEFIAHRTPSIDVRCDSGVFSHKNTVAFIVAKHHGLLKFMRIHSDRLFAPLTRFVYSAGQSTAFLTAKLSAFFFNHVFRRNKIFIANRTLNCFHVDSIAHPRRQGKPFFGLVFDIQVEDEHCFTLACGLVAHNCPFCQQMDGTVVDLDENFLEKGDEQDVPWRGQEIVMRQDYSAVGGPPLHPNCIVYGDTPIITFAGLKKIKHIKVGDLVLTHRGHFRKVIRTFLHSYTGKTVRLFFGGLLWVTLTEDHPVLVGGVWKVAKDIVVGDQAVVARDCGFVNTPVLGIDRGQVESRAVYNLSVEEDESYVAKGVVVHNCRCVLVAELDEEKMLSQKGGPGSGNFGHEGRPGEVGGSGPGGSQTVLLSKLLKEEIEHKLGILAEENDLLADYGITKEEADGLVDSLPKDGGAWTVPGKLISVVQAELNDHAEILRDLGAHSDRPEIDMMQAGKLARRLETLFNKTKSLKSRSPSIVIPESERTNTTGDR